MELLAIKVDVDTLRGYREGVPRLLDVLDSVGAKASFFFSMGPDRSGLAIRRIFRPGFLAKMLRTRAPSTYGWRTLFYGTLLPAPMIVPSAPGVIRDAVRRGHDCGVHAWDHVKWQDRLPKLPPTTIEADFRRAFDLFRERAGFRPRAVAAPGWQVTDESLRIQDELGLLYASDCRGVHPFLPRMGRRLFRTLQIPTTLPTLDEILGSGGIDGKTAPEAYLRLMRPGLNVLTIHAEMEGLSQLEAFRTLMERCRERGARFLTLEAVARTLDPADLPRGSLEMRPIFGRAGRVATQVPAETPRAPEERAPAEPGPGTGAPTAPSKTPPAPREGAEGSDEKTGMEEPE
jgi:peptidoglycan/xylan/chitin deacetylase (PgdA/CDA1 family)